MCSQFLSNGSNENDCWALYVGTSDASRIKDLKIDGVETEPEMLTKDPGWMVVSNDRKKIPLEVTYKIYTGNEAAGWMDVTVNYDVKKYGVYVDGKELTSLNFYDIPGLKSGTAYLKDEPEGIGWSGYLPTLALSDAKIEGEEGIRNERAYYLKIIVKGDNEVTSTDYNAFANNSAGVETVCKNAPNGYTSIYADVRDGRRTEVDTISGSVVDAAHALGVSVPCHEMIVSLIHALERRPRA